MTARACKVLIIGGGPGGYVAAIRAGQLGLDTVLVEEGAVGGTCLNVGCIPSKALIHTAEVFSDACALAVDNPFGITSAAPQIDLARAVAWKDGIVSRLTGGVATLLRKARVNVLQGRAQIMDGKTVEVTATDGTVETLRCENLVIATGARAQTIPTLPFGGDILSSTEVLALETVPKRLCVVGGGYIGLEIGTAMAKLGAQVTIVEAAPQLLPLYDDDLIKPVARRLAALNVQVLTEARAQNYADGQLEVMVGETRELIAADKVLVTVGRVPNIDGFGLETLGLDRNGRYLAVDDTAAPRCAAFMRLAMSLANRCSHIGRWRRGSCGARHCRRTGRLGQACHAGCLLYRSGDRRRRSVAHAGRQCRCRSLSLRGQWPRNDAGPG